MSGATSFTYLPSELLHQILVLVTPSDLSNLCQTCRSLNHHITSSDHLWKQVFEQRFDSPRVGVKDPIITLPCPKSRSLSTKGKGKETSAQDKQTSVRNNAERKLYIECHTFDHEDSFDFIKQVQRRTWAEKRIQRLHSRPIELVANYNETMRALLSVVRSRQFTSAKQESAEATSSLNSQYLIDLLTSNRNIETYKKLIYPRTDINRLRQWQLTTLTEKHGKGTGEALVKKTGSEKRNRSASSTSATPRDEKRSKVISGGPGARTRRRSARLLLNTYPPELHHLLYDKDGNNLIDLDDGQGIVCLEEIELLDEQLAAELHVLHGIRPNKPSSKQTTRSSTAAEDEESESAQVEESQSNGAGATEEEGEDDEEGLHHHHHHNHHHHHQHLPFEQPLGSESGYEGDDRLRGRAREIVYDTANYGPENGYGPLRAWRERWEPIDGRRAEHRLARDEENGEDNDGDNDDEEEEENMESLSSPLFIDVEAEEEEASPEVEYGDDVPVVDLTNAESVASAIAGGLLNEYDPDEDDEDDDEDFDMDDDDEDDEDILMMEVREMAIALSHGLYPYHESKRLKKAMMEYDHKSCRQKAWIAKKVDTRISELETSSSPPSLNNVWRMEKRIDWVIVEAIMIVMFCNIRHAVVNHGWGRSFRLPDSVRSLSGRDAEARRLYSNQGSTHNNGAFYEEWRNLLCLPCGWNLSRGDSKRVPPIQESLDKESDDSKRKPFDYAGVESTWIGTYAFLDWSKWAAFNARDPISRGLPEPSCSSDPTKPSPLGNLNTMPSLKNEREAVGDCLQLRLELLPVSEQKAPTKREEAIEELEGQKANTKYPPLRFKGQTLTYDEGPPTPRGQVHGVVRPIFATAHEDYYTKESSDKDDEERAIVGLHWDLVHRYDGEDRWSLSGVQPGPPGTKAPIYGVWGSSQRSDELSPCGPFTYFLVDERPWKEIDELLAQERRR